MKFRFDITQEEYLRLHAYHMQHSWQGNNAAKVWKFLVPAIVLVVLMLLYRAGMGEIPILCTTVVLALVSYLWMRTSSKWMIKFMQSNVRRLMKKGIKFYDAEGEIEFGEEKIVQTGGEKERTAAYKDIDSVTDDGQQLMIRYDGNQYMLLPKRCIGKKFGQLKGLLDGKGHSIENI